MRSTITLPLLAASLSIALPASASRPIGESAGDGPYPAIAEAVDGAPGYTIYRPVAPPRQPMPLVLWGNGGCRNNGLSAAHFLRQIASHGYFVIANGAPKVEPPVLSRLPEVNGPPLPPPGLPFSPPRATPDETSVAQLLAGIDWAKRANASVKGPYRHRIDVSRVAVMGHSCGGLQALAAGADPRVSAVIAFDSGVYNRPGSGLSGVHIDKDDLRKLHTPVAYFIGGPADIAYVNAADDVDRIGHVPVFFANLPVSHGGTFNLANGGDWGRAGAAWLDWQLKHDRTAARWFVGADCRLCTSYGWTIVRKQFPESPEACRLVERRGEGLDRNAVRQLLPEGDKVGPGHFYQRGHLAAQPDA